MYSLCVIWYNAARMFFNLKMCFVFAKQLGIITMNQIFVPATQIGLQVSEFPLKDILAVIPDNPIPYIRSFDVGDKSYKVDLGAVRYHLVKQSLICACCSVKINRCFLELNKQMTEQQGVDSYSFNFYAECGELNGNRYLTLMTRDHIVPQSRGGQHCVENSQLLCVHCNTIKNDSDLTLQQIRALMFPAYRAYKSTFPLNSTKALLEPYRQIIKKNRNTVNAINNALNLVNDNRVIDMRSRRDRCFEEAERLQAECDRIEYEAQVTGIIPKMADLECLKHVK